MYDKFTKAKSVLILEQPFFATLSMSMKWVRDDTIPTMATDGETVYWNAAFVDSMTANETKFVICHEIMHCVLEHIDRLGDRDMYKWNVATDIVINDMLITANVGTMPKMGIHEPELAKKGNYLADAVYRLLPDTKVGSQGGAFGAGKNAMTRGPLDRLRPRPGGPAQKAQAAAEMKVLVAQAAQAAKMCGKLSVGLERFVGEVLRPKVNWREALRDFVTSKAKVDRTWARPNRRFLSQGLYMPSLTGERLGPMLIAIDCSGSIGPRELAEFTAELRAIHEDGRPEMLHVVYFDSEISHYETYNPGDTLNIRPHGGGGTAFAPIFKYAAAHAIEPDACIVLTDGYCSDYGPPPAYPVMWTTTGETKFPWGRVLEMKD